MATHEPKSCQRCNNLFECKTGTIVQCQCYGINFNEDEKEIIARSFSDCLCRNCLLEIKQEIKYRSLIEKQEQINILLKTR
ncbi:cysteine-rich CWC family protein [Solitalea lacus]|uniref:cysteine-rich CWC family protein n=1 Tax=Solitalea lacus TaxID=2911172 RepID=UPI001ED9E88B|nr:cysteine-rich CWC family protein [Solitalea lacus]UKJ05796.1 cysteine-rich CWC family protein [Solitalea lacus]